MGEQLLELSEVVELLRIAGRRREQDRSAQVVISRLTRREREVLQALADGLNDREIAERLHISTETVRTHMVNILRKLGVDSRLQALVFAARHGIVKIV
jgi:DNA-binding NarL/FixJ family response regulator